MRSPRRSQPSCPTCDYLLTGLAGPVCPECGETIDWKAAWSLVRDTPRWRALKWGVLGLFSGALAAGMSAFGLVLFAPGFVFGVVVVVPLLRVDRASSSSWFGGVLASCFAYWLAFGVMAAVGAVFERVLGFDVDQPLIAFVAIMTLTGTSGAALLDCMLRPIESRRPPIARLSAAMVAGAIGGGIPALARLWLDHVNVLGFELYLVWFCGTFILWQTAVAAAFGIYAVPRCDIPITAAPESSRSPPDPP